VDAVYSAFTTLNHYVIKPENTLPVGPATKRARKVVALPGKNLAS